MQTKNNLRSLQREKNVKKGDKDEERLMVFLGDSKLSTLQEIIPLEKLRLS